jgi:hypothetical protein
MTERQRKMLRLYGVTLPDGRVMNEVHELELERILGESPDSESPDNE